MPPVRIPEVSGLQPTAVNAPPVDPRAASAPARALGSVATAIGSVGQAFAEHGDRIQAAENQRAISSTRSRLDEMRSELFLELQTENDPAAHIRRTDTFLQQARNLIDDPELAPEARDRLLPYFDGWATDTRTTVAERAAGLSLKRADLASKNELEQAVNHDDFDRANSILDERVANGIDLPEEADATRSQLKRQIAFREIKRNIEADPLGYAPELDDPEFFDHQFAQPGLSLDDLDRLRSFGDQARNRAAADMLDEIHNAALDGTVLSPDDLRELVDQGILTASQRASYQRAYLSDAPPQPDPALYDQIHSAVTTYDPAADPTGLALANLRAELATVALPKEHVSELRSRLDEQARPPGSRTTRHRLTSDFSKITDERFDAGHFGDWFQLDGSTKVIDRENFEDAVIRKRGFLDRWEAYLDAAPDDLSPEEARTTYDFLFEASVRDANSFLFYDNLAPNVDYGPMIDELIGYIDQGPGVLPAKEPKLDTFGGVRLRRPGEYYRGAGASVFGGTNDPVDSGINHMGQRTGPGGVEGVAIPQAVLEASYPGKSKSWYTDNVRIVVKTPAGATRVFPIADLGTEEKIWQKNGRPVLDFTPGALRQIGGRVILDQEGKQHGVSGVDSLDFAITTVDAGMPLQGAPWSQVWDRWFQQWRPTTAGEIEEGLRSLIKAWHEANAED